MYRQFSWVRDVIIPVIVAGITTIVLTILLG